MTYVKIQMPAASATCARASAASSISAASVVRNAASLVPIVRVRKCYVVQRCVIHANIYVSQLYHVWMFSVRKVPLGDTCDRLDRCLDSQASCQGGLCRCNQAYFERNGICVAKILLNRGCQTNSDVCLDDNAFCQGGVCLCDPLYFEKNSQCGKWPLSH